MGAKAKELAFAVAIFVAGTLLAQALVNRSRIVRTFVRG